MGAAIKDYEGLGGGSNHPAATKRDASIPQGFEVILSEGTRLRVRLRRSLHRGNPLGVAILHRACSSPAMIEQFDIAPKLTTERRKYAEEQLVAAYQMCESSTSYAEGRRALEQMVEEGVLASCRFGALGLACK